MEERDKSNNDFGSKFYEFVEKLKALETNAFNITESYIQQTESHKEKIAEYEELAKEKIQKIELISEKSTEVLSILNTTLNNIEVTNTNVVKADDLLLKSTDTHQKSEVVYKNLINKKNQIDEIYYEIMGYTDGEGEEKHEVAGLKDKLEKSYIETSENLKNLNINAELKYKDFIQSFNLYQESEKDKLDLFYIEWNQELNQLKNEISQLLPNALTAGLSHAYEAKRTQEEVEAKRHQKKFNWAIFVMSIFALIPVGIGYYEYQRTYNLDEVIKNLPTFVSIIIPLYIPALWIGYFSNKQINLSKRLIEEYSHKEALSKTFEGLSKQIYNLKDGEVAAELRTKLLYTVLEVSSENPGKLITDYNKADHPLMDALEKSIKLTAAVEKLARIPGFRKLAGNFATKIDSDLNEKEQQANKGLDTVEK